MKLPQVDREERPDVDRLYMTFLQVTAGGGGWPMSVCSYTGWPSNIEVLMILVGLTPDLHPFFAGVCGRSFTLIVSRSSLLSSKTYFPSGRFRQILYKLAELCAYRCVCSTDPLLIRVHESAGRANRNAARVLGNRSSSSCAPRQRFVNFLKPQ